MSELFKDEQLFENPFDTTVTHVVPSKMENQIEENKKLFGRRIKQLKVIINDLNYLSTGNTYREFIIDMSSALVHGRKITPKMELAITNIVKKYTEHLRKENDTDYQRKKLNFIENSLAKIGMVKRALKRAKYTDGYTARSTYFLSSVEDHLKNTSKLSVKQRKALNSMYKRFEKRVNIGIKI